MGISGSPRSQDRVEIQLPTHQDQLRASRKFILIPSAVSLLQHSPAAGSAPALLPQLTHLDTGISRGRISKGKNAKDLTPGFILPQSLQACPGWK